MQPPAVSGKVLPGTAPPGAGWPLGPSLQLRVAGLADPPFPPHPTPSQVSPGAAPGARQGGPQNCTRRLGVGGTIAPPLLAPLAPAWAPGRSVCWPSLPFRSFPSLLPRAPPGVPGTASDSSLPAARVSFPRGGGQGGGGGAGSISVATALFRLERASSSAAPRPFPAVPRGCAPRPCLLLSQAGGALGRIPPPAPPRTPRPALP